jgi:DNA repair protein RadA
MRNPSFDESARISRTLINQLLEDADWISRETKIVLKRSGLVSLLDLALAPRQVIQGDGLEEEYVARLSEEAGGKIGCVRRGRGVVGSGARRRRISTGSSALDILLGGGVSSGRVTEFYGESGSGKTQLCFQLCVNALIPPIDKGDVVFVDTCGTFRPERIAEMATGRIDKDRLFGRIFVVNARTVADQSQLPRDRETGAPKGIGMLVIDTLTDNFIYDFQGESHVASRQSSLARHLHDLAEMALDQNIPIVVANTARTQMLDTGEDRVVETGGTTVGQGVHVRLRLERDYEGWIGRLGGEGKGVRFKIVKNGITDWEE